MTTSAENIIGEQTRVIENSVLDETEEQNGNAQNEELQDNNSESDQDNNSESTSDEETEDNPFPIKEGTERYVITLNGIPRFYSKDATSARKSMWDMARTLRREGDYETETYIEESSNQNCIKVIGRKRYLIISVYQTLYYLSVEKVHEIFEATDDSTILSSTIGTDMPGGFFAQFFG